jgi:hypothetical protein
VSTNYYVRPPGTKGEGIHLGKTAVGWPFMFRAYPNADERPAGVTWDVTDYSSWVDLLSLGQITTEAGTPIEKDDLLDLVDEYRRLNGIRHRPQGRQYEDENGNLFTPQEFC